MTSVAATSHVEEPLNYPLTFQYTEAARGRANVPLLSEGEYRAVALRTYANHQRCDGCERREKAKKLVAVEQVTAGKRKVYEVGLKCMQRLYGVDAAHLGVHAASVARTRASLRQKLGLTGDVTTRFALGVVREAVATYVPAPGRHLEQIDAMDEFTLDAHDSDGMRDLYELARYHQEWQEEPERAHARWTALRTHPAFQYTSHRGRVTARCDEALRRKTSLPDGDVVALNADLRRAVGRPDRRAALARPEEHPDAAAYEAALRRGLESHLLRGNFDAQPWAPPHADRHGLNPLKFVEPGGSHYGMVAAWANEVEAVTRIIDGTGDYSKYTRRALILTGDADQTLVQAAVIRPRRNEDNELEDRVVEPERTFRYRRVAWALVEPYHPTYDLWRAFGRHRLERYG